MSRWRPLFLLTAAAMVVACRPLPVVDPVEPPPTAPSPTTSAPAAATPAPAHAAAAASPAGGAIPDAIAQAVAAADRSDADRALDGQRHSATLLAFFQIAPGQRVAELGAGGGYTTELLARVVGAEGAVYGQNTPFILKRFAEAPWSARLKKPVMANVTRLDTAFDAPFPETVRNLDAVLDVLFYHDTVWMKTDRAAMNAGVFKALKPGGIYGIVDHAARAGDGIDHTQDLHRIEESVVVAEVKRAGFVLEASSDVLRNPGDAKDWSASPSKAGDRRGTSDRFVLRFRKPE